MNSHRSTLASKRKQDQKYSQNVSAIPNQILANIDDEDDFDYGEELMNNNRAKM